MEERTVNIMLNATAEINRKETEDIYLPIRSSEYRDLIRDNADLAAQVKIAEKEAVNFGSESFRRGERIAELKEEVAELKEEIAELKKKLAEVKEAAE